MMEFTDTKYTVTIKFRGNTHTYKGCITGENPISGAEQVQDASGATIAVYHPCMGWTFPGRVDVITVLMTNE